MGAAVEKLISQQAPEQRNAYAFDDVRALQVEAMNERFRERRDKIKLVARRAEEAGITEIRDHADAAPLLLPHTAYKSYPEAWLMEEKWDKLGRWMDTVSTYRVPKLDPSTIADMDDWIGKLEAEGHCVSCSSGTTGKSAMLVASRADMEWVGRETLATYIAGSGLRPAADRRMFGLAAVAHVPRNLAGATAYEAYRDPDYPRFPYPVSPMTVGGLTKMVVLRKKMADGTALPSEIADFEATSAARAAEVDAAVEKVAEAVIAARDGKIHVSGLWGGIYNVAKAVRDRGYSAKDFHPDNSIYVGGGLKRAVLPPDYQEFVYETFNIRPDRYFQNYSMQELHSGMPKCQAGGRYHVPPWVVPLLLDKAGDNLLPLDQKNEYEGRAAFFDLSIDGRWGGVISGDRVSIDFSPCKCGSPSPSIRDNVTRYADLEGDDKIGCAGTVDAYVRGVAA